MDISFCGLFSSGNIRHKFLENGDDRQKRIFRRLYVDVYETGTDRLRGIFLVLMQAKDRRSSLSCGYFFDLFGTFGNLSLY